MSQTLHDWFRSTFGQAMLGAVLLWAALPPLGLAPLAWIAPVFWILLIRADKLPLLGPAKRTAPGRPWLLFLAAVALLAAEIGVTEWFHAQDYKMYWLAEVVFWPALIALFYWAARRWAAHPHRCLWLAGMFFWLADLHWLRLPYWAIGFGWLGLGIYFGCYLPAFVGLSRIGVHRLRLPVILVAPAVWTGLQLAQAHLLSGMTMGCLDHTQYRMTSLIQISDVTGCYGVTFLVMFVAACLARMLPCDGRRWTPWPLVPAAAMLAAVLLYGHWRIGQAATEPGLKIALVQGNFDIRLENPKGFRQAVDKEYSRLTRDERCAQADVIVWPETVFSCIDEASGECAPWITGDDDATLPADFPRPSPEAFHKWLDSWKSGTHDMMTQAAKEFGRPMVVGVERQHYGPHGIEIFNTAVLITPDGRWFDQPPDQYFYDKTHLVPFGEYMPFAKELPWLQSLSPLGSGSSASDRPACFRVKNVNLVPNICYESTLPHVIRDQLVRLREEGREGRVLVNLTNDGWFWGSSELKMHLACGVFRTVECRRPMVVAANTGISAWIDGNGHIVTEGKRHDTDLIVADVRLDRRESWYLRHGDWFAGACLAVVILLAAAGAVERVRIRSPRRSRGAFDKSR